jgi:O-methyltransferase
MYFYWYSKLLKTDKTAIQEFISNGSKNVSKFNRRIIIYRIIVANANIEGASTNEEILQIMSYILNIPIENKGCIVEAGCWKGLSTAKISIAAKIANRKFYVFDSYEGLPENDEVHGESIFGQDFSKSFPQGELTGTLEEVKNNVQKYGEISVCEFVKGYFEDTLPHFKEQIATAFCDVDLAMSTKTCLKYFYPLVIPGSIIFSHDGHIPLCVEAVNDENFWLKDVGVPKPRMEGFGTSRLAKIYKF